MVAYIGRMRGHDRGRSLGNEKVIVEMRELRARLEDMETNRRRNPEAGDIMNLRMKRKEKKLYLCRKHQS